MINKSPATYLARHGYGKQPGIFPRARFRSIKWAGPDFDNPDTCELGAPHKSHQKPGPSLITDIDYGLITEPATKFIDYGWITKPVGKKADFGHIS